MARGVTVPLWRAHHRDLHRVGEEVELVGEDRHRAAKVARQLWLSTLAPVQQ